MSKGRNQRKTYAAKAKKLKKLNSRQAKDNSLLADNVVVIPVDRCSLSSGEEKHTDLTLESFWGVDHVEDLRLNIRERHRRFEPKSFRSPNKSLDCPTSSLEVIGYDGLGNFICSRDESECNGHQLLVTNLEFGITKKDLESTFIKFGLLREIWLSDWPPHFAFVVFARKEAAEIVCGVDLKVKSRRISVKMIDPLKVLIPEGYVH